MWQVVAQPWWALVIQVEVVWGEGQEMAGLPSHGKHFGPQQRSAQRAYPCLRTKLGHWKQNRRLHGGWQQPERTG